VKHAKYLAIVGIVFGIISLIMPGEGQPLWYRIALLVLMPPAVLFGGIVRAKQAGKTAPTPWS